MAKKKVKNKKASTKYRMYDKEGKRKACCPKCGPGVFLAEHKDRQTCGTCRYTVFKKKQ